LGCSWTASKGQSREQLAELAKLENQVTPSASILRHHRGETHSQAVDERESAAETSSESQPGSRVGGHSSDWLRRIFLWGRGPAGEGPGGGSGARPRPEAQGIAKMKREEGKDGEG
jgi:hypothetical protein